MGFVQSLGGEVLAGEGDVKKGERWYLGEVGPGATRVVFFVDFY
jgi:hypothetical protein